MGTSFSKKQWDSLKELINQCWYPQQKQVSAPPQRSPAPPSIPPSAPPPASPPAQKPCAPASPELPPQPISSPVSARSYPPSLSVEDEEEVEEKQVYKIPLRNVKQMRQKFGAKKVSSSRVSEFFETCVAWPAKFGGIDMRFSRDEELDAWYTTMLNATDALPHWI